MIKSAPPEPPGLSPRLGRARQGAQTPQERRAGRRDASLVTNWKEVTRAEQDVKIKSGDSVAVFYAPPAETQVYFPLGNGEGKTDLSGGSSRTRKAELCRRAT